jgi:predicted alpha/beta superfamily hydrolase
MFFKTFCLFLILSPAIISQQLSTISFNIITNFDKNDSSKVFITGSYPELGNWNPATVGLMKVSDTLWTKSFTLTNGTEIEYKFTLGSWEREALNENKQVPQNSVLYIQRDTIITLKITNWGKQISPLVYGQITGKVNYHHNFNADKIADRDLIVWLPPGYDENADERYPVLYMHDGQNIIDPATSSFGFDWQVDETADSLIKSGDIQKIIIVGINNSKNRWGEYTPGDTGKAYMDFIVNKVKPFIDSHYRTFSGRENTAIGGSSLGGLISFMMVWEYPEVFSKAICVSPAFQIGALDYVQNVLKYSGEKKQVKIYIDNGGVGLDKRFQPGVDEMLRALNSRDFLQGRDIYYYFDTNAQHSEMFWASRFWRALKFLFAVN